MVERQDIDALLIGALYGELTPAEERRLAAHLETHPADKALFADLTHARELVRESRILDAQPEPPKQLSTLLLQEAARRAPRESKESWFTRFLRSLVAHPAMAAAMMLVIVIGFAAIITQREGDHFAGSEESVSSRAAPASAEVSPEPAAEPVAAGAELDHEPAKKEAYGAPLEQYEVTLTEREAAPTAAPPPRRKAAERAGDAIAEVPAKRAVPAAQEPASLGDSGPAKPLPAKRTGRGGPLEVRTQTPQPKDLDEGIPAQRAERKSAPRPPAVATGYAPPPPPTAGAIARDDSAGATPGAATADKAADPQLAWARQQHAQVVAQVRAGNCRQAAALAVALESRAPQYYAQNVERDRALKDCGPYIVSERQRQVERARATEQPAATDAK